MLSRSALIFVSEHFRYIEIISLLIIDDNAIMHTINDQFLSSNSRLLLY